MTSDSGECLAIIPARSGSKRFPDKNIAELNGKPLLGRAVETAQRSGVFTTVCVSTDDDEYKGIAEEYGADYVDDRPEKLGRDEAQVKDVCFELLSRLKQDRKAFDYFGLLLPTSPLRTADDIKQAHEKFMDSTANYLMSLVEFSHPPERAVRIDNERVVPHFGRDKMTRAQELDTLYRHDGSVIFAQTEVFLTREEFYGDDVAAYEMPPERAVDIDSPMDLRWAKFLLSESNQQF